ncbi:MULTISPECIES: TPM domain-containing protein [Vitreoscilla]|uniref:TPM domain-containing protein n=1 Tax=Vitreoscilla stercoraria TaxID=61 RepID=A0ABY4E8A7_VITST|nr:MULTISPECIES: TPM domain-containing protein [Vitreoscilla]AUZ04670.1 hypothetical protein ADP71_09570 [Vitreoscilla sp. C1]UOO91640.1 TPM domain-containing protein [Vitreoscilla stercoraria]
MHTTNRFQRLWRHATASHKKWQQQFPKSLLTRIETLIAASEPKHLGQIRVVIENNMPLSDVWANVSPRERAWQCFGELGVWDTEYNTGVLLYIGWSDRALEIVADRGIARQVDEQVWQKICQQLSQAFVAQQFETGTETALQQLTDVLQAHIPRDGSHIADNELSDEVVVR